VRDVTVLWALRSPCNLGCTYCYFGTIEEHRDQGVPTQSGQLSHLSRNDTSLADITAFCSTLADSAVGRIVIAGGEPLIWPPILSVLEQITQAGVEVVIATNGIPLNRPEITQRIVDLGISALSVSLDSSDPTYNDHYRPSRNRKDGWHQVLSGIRAVQHARGERKHPKLGLYAAIGRGNIDAVSGVAALGAELGIDYYVPQPISLDRDHALFQEMSLTAEDEPELRAEFTRLYQTNLPVALPDPSYVEQFLASIATTDPGFVRQCFGGADLFFIEPDGSVWDCPSALRIAATPPERQRTIRHATAAELFPATARHPCGDCGLFSRDCVSMWPLMDFSRFLHSGTGAA
jgi:MoaA/NifB/PqqE/SkfB family radical SAM enzyme